MIVNYLNTFALGIKKPVSGVCFLHSLCSARGKKEAGGAMDENQEEIWACGGSSGFRLSWQQPLP